jgi:hypothetical protein
MSAMFYRVLLITGWLVIVSCAIIERNVSIIRPSVTESRIVWMEQMNRFVTGMLVTVRSESFHVQIKMDAKAPDVQQKKRVRTNPTVSGVRMQPMITLCIGHGKIGQYLIIKIDVTINPTHKSNS